MNAPLQRSEAWFAQRVSMITASRVGSILDGSAAEVAKVKRAMVREYLGEPAEGDLDNNPDVQRGVIHEPDAISALEMETGLLIKDCPFIVHPQIEWLGASPDGVAADDGNVEVKCPRKLKPMAEKRQWWHQAQAQMFCTGRRHTWFCQWTADGHQVDKIEVDDTWFETYGWQLEAFYNDYLATIADPKKCQEHIDPEVQDMSDNEQWIAISQEAHYIKSQMDALKARQDELKAQAIELAAGQKSSGCDLNVFPTTRKGSISEKKLADAGLDANAFRGKSSTSWTMQVR